jgi:hypothetical protein
MESDEGSIFQEISEDKTDVRNQRGTFVAESKLLSQLHTRKPLILKAPDGKQLGISKLPAGLDGEPMLAEDLKFLRQEEAAERRRVKFAEADEVKSLHHQKLGSTDAAGSGTETIKSLSERRKKRHDDASAVWDSQRKRVYDDMEDKVQAARACPLPSTHTAFCLLRIEGV